MSRILNIQSSPYMERSASRSVSKAYIDRYVAANPDSVVVDLDLVANPPAHLGTHHMTGLFRPPPHSPESAEALEISEAYLQQLFDSDVIVVATPMHNFGISSTLKAWIDYIVRNGRTFSFGGSDGQYIGLVPSSKRLVAVVASGDLYSAGPMAAMDHTVDYIKVVFNFMGFSDVSVIRAERQNSSKMAAKGLADALAEAQALADSHSAVDAASRSRA